MHHHTTPRPPGPARLASAGLALALAAALAMSACQRDAAPVRDTTGEHPAFAAIARPRSTVRTVAADTLSDAAHILALVPEPDGQTVAVLFADSVQGVGSGLALNELGEDRMQLLWPDSVSAVWWPAPHSIAFTTHTGRGVRVVVDVHAESLTVLQRLGDSVVTRPAAPDEPSGARARATEYVDSLHVQPGGEPTSGALRYAVTRIVPQPDSGGLVAFHVLATAPGGARSNPAWYILDPRTSQVTKVDDVVGPPEQMPDAAAAWTGTGDFVYAKGLTIWVAEPTRRGLAAARRPNRARGEPWTAAPKALDYTG